MNPNPAETPDSGPNLEKIESALAEIAKIELPPQAQTAVQTLSLEVKHITDSLKQAQAEAQAAKQDKAKFVSVVTHELRLPLTSINPSMLGSMPAFDMERMATSSVLTLPPRS